MISYIRGPLIEIDEEAIVVEAGCVGYHIRVPLSLLDRLPALGGEVRIYTYLQVREDAMSLYGFLSRQDLKMFKQLLGVSGIGPKGALGLLSAMSPEALRLAIASGDVKAISRAPGIGSKTAQRLILDLRDRVEIPSAVSLSSGALEEKGGALRAAGKEAAAALEALGYSGAEAARAVRQVEMAEGMSTEEVLRASLKYLAR